MMTTPWCLHAFVAPPSSSPPPARSLSSSGCSSSPPKKLLRLCGEAAEFFFACSPRGCLVSLFCYCSSRHRRRHSRRRCCFFFSFVVALFHLRRDVNLASFLCRRHCRCFCCRLPISTGPIFSGSLLLLLSSLLELLIRVFLVLVRLVATCGRLPQLPRFKLVHPCVYQAWNPALHHVCERAPATPSTVQALVQVVGKPKLQQQFRQVVRLVLHRFGLLALVLSLVLVLVILLAVATAFFVRVEVEVHVFLLPFFLVLFFFIFLVAVVVEVPCPPHGDPHALFRPRRLQRQQTRHHVGGPQRVLAEGGRQQAVARQGDGSFPQFFAEAQRLR
mmetsp:Transcript_55040/g.103211  ORF Transcript_55040/g.103211 Transcript_55040/m.103211 type:complete len:332 (+) Transcript_55040:1026-2021(+)